MEHWWWVLAVVMLSTTAVWWRFSRTARLRRGWKDRR